MARAADNADMNTALAARSPDPLSIPSRLGYLGLLPFVLGAALVWIVRADVHAYVALALSTYAALILSFLGAIHWGLAMRQPANNTTAWVWGVVPALAHDPQEVDTFIAALRRKIWLS